MRAIRFVLPLAVAGALGFGLAACGGSSAAKSATANTTAAPVTTAAPTTVAPTTVAPTTTTAPATTAPATTAPAAPAATLTIHIHNFAFSPNPLRVKAGDMITIVNDDTVSHTFTADAGGFDSGIIAAGKSMTVTVKGSGTVGYHCNIHTFMKGTLTVG
jgi:plastocyanin